MLVLSLPLRKQAKRDCPSSILRGDDVQQPVASSFAGITDMSPGLVTFCCNAAGAYSMTTMLAIVDSSALLVLGWRD